MDDFRDSQAVFIDQRRDESETVKQVTPIDADARYLHGVLLCGTLHTESWGFQTNRSVDAVDVNSILGSHLDDKPGCCVSPAWVSGFTVAQKPSNYLARGSNSFLLLSFPSPRRGER